LVDSSGFHLDLGAGRVIEIPSEQMSSRIKIDQYGLLQVFDEQNIIAAEYDPDQKNWVDINNLAEGIPCPSKCIYDQYRGTPNSAWVNMASTEIFRSVDAIDNQTGEMRVLKNKFLIDSIRRL